MLTVKYGQPDLRHQEAPFPIQQVLVITVPIHPIRSPVQGLATQIHIPLTKQIIRVHVVLIHVAQVTACHLATQGGQPLLVAS